MNADMMSLRESEAGRRRGALVACVAAVAFLCFGPVKADDRRGTPAERQACTPDVFRLCSGAIPDEGRIVACLEENSRKLSGPCRAVISEPDSRDRKARFQPDR
jgi:hypothetical protein